MTRSPGAVIVGADVLEIMSIAMYAEPLVVYRELVQNSADGIDEAIRRGVLGQDSGRISVSFDRGTRSVSIVDNGFGLPNESFVDQMLAFGASAKRHDTYRGFRGIGRLAGLGHCQHLLFRSRSKGDNFVFEARWDGAKVRELILAQEVVPLEDLAHHAVQIGHAPARDCPAHFFEVRMEGVRRTSDDRLFDHARIATFLAQVAPVPFARDFKWAEMIKAELVRRAPLLEVTLAVADRLVHKPYMNEMRGRGGRVAAITEIEPVEIPAVDERTAAFGWIAHHDYLGALEAAYPARGLRVRSGNLQIGDDTILAKAFPEERFNAWAVGELHVFDPRLRANARRDAFEPSVHVDNLFNQLLPYGASIARRCRMESKRRNETRRVDAITATLDDVNAALRKNRSALADAVRQLIAEDVFTSLEALHPDGSAPKAPQALKTLERRAGRLAVPRASKTALTKREEGRLDVIRWLGENGYAELLGAVVAAMTSKA